MGGSLKILKCLFLVLLIFVTNSCKEESLDSTLIFIGDSQVHNWDVEKSFPNRFTKNYGINGAGINDFSGIHITEGEVVVEIGTNDIKAGMTQSEIEDYVVLYEGIISSISSNQIFVISVLPTAYVDRNKSIVLFNQKAKEGLKSHKNIKFIHCYDRFVNDSGTLRDDLSRDGLHINDYGYMILSDKIKMVL